MALRRETKRRLAGGTARYPVNPVVRSLFRLGLPAPGTAILETIGRKSGRPRRTPVTNGLDDATTWPTRALHRRVGGRHHGPSGRTASGTAPPPAAASNRACGSPAHGSPTSFTAGKRKRRSHRSAQAIDADPDRPPVIEPGDPVAALESVLGAGEDRESDSFLSWRPSIWAHSRKGGAPSRSPRLLLIVSMKKGLVSSGGR